MFSSKLSKGNDSIFKLDSILLSLGIVLGILAIIFAEVLQYRKQGIKIEELRAGNLQKGSITYDKLAEDVFTTIELEFENGATSKAKIVNGMVENGGLGGQLEFETESGEKVIGQVIGTIPMVIEDGSITEEKISKVLIERIEKLEEGNLIEEESMTDTDTGIAEETDTETEFEIEDGSIVTAKLADNGVTTLKLADGSVTTVKIVDASITSSKIQDANILTKHLASGAITTVKIADGAVTTSKLGNSSVTSSKIQDGTILNADIYSDAAISYTKLNLVGSLLLADLGQNGCTNGQVIKWSDAGSTWECASDIDTQLSEAQVEGYITNEVVDLFTGSTMNSEALATQSWVNGLGYITDGNTDWDNSYGFITASSSTTLTNKTLDGDDNTVQDLTVTSLKSGVLETDLSSVSASDDTLASAKAIKLALESLYPVGVIFFNASVATNPSTLLGFGTWVAFGAGQVMVGLDSGDGSFDTLGETGGEKTHTLTIAEMPEHNHSVNPPSTPTSTDGSHTHKAYEHMAGGSTAMEHNNTTPIWNSVGQARASQIVMDAAGDHSHTVDISSFNSASAGSGDAHNNLQPYITVYMWVRTK